MVKGRTTIPTSAEVVIVGNGPSGLFTSYLLHGHRPASAWSSASSSSASSASSRDYAPIDCASRIALSGLEHPAMAQYARMECEAEAEGGLQWGRTARSLSHVVLGRGPIGGHIWGGSGGGGGEGGADCRGDPWKALSDGVGIQLPGLPYYSDLWTNPSPSPPGQRVTLAAASAYYSQYVHTTGIASAIHPHTEVCGIHLMEEAMAQGLCACPYRPTGPCHRCSPYRFLLHGRSLGKAGEVGVDFWIRTDAVVLATGISESPRPLPAHLVDPIGSTDRDRWLIRTPRMLPFLDPGKVDPVLVVGDGLSAADAIHALLSRGTSIIHVFPARRRSPISRVADPDIYPEYWMVWRRMLKALRATGPDMSPVDGYIGRPGSVIQEMGEGWVRVQEGEAPPERIAVSSIIFLTGSCMSPSFFRGSLVGCSPTGTEGDIRAWSTQAPPPLQATHGRILDTQAYKPIPGMYIVGALSGQTLVRHIPGLCLAALAGLEEDLPM